MTQNSNLPLPTYVGDLDRLSAVCLKLTALLPPRATARQMSAFFIVTTAIAMGRSITLSELLQIRTDDKQENPILGTGAERILVPFLKPTKRDPEAVGWLEMGEDENDRRRKPLALTELGREVLGEIIATLRQETK